MKRMKKVAAVLLSSILTASSVPSNMLISYAVENTTVITNGKDDDISDGTVIDVKKTWGMPGEQVNVVLSMENNPGIVGLTLQIEFNDTVMSLVNAENGIAVNGSNISFTPPSSGSNYVWAGASVSADEISDGTLLTLTFKINEDAKCGEYPISVSCSDAVDNDLKQVPINIKNNSFSIIDYIPGDTSGDGKIAMNDLVLLVRYIADNGYNENGYAAKVNKDACDVNADNNITVVDAVLLSRYIADGGKCNPNGYNATLYPTPFMCNHSSLKHFEAIEAASCEKDGNIEYWYCEDCDKYYNDELCQNEISKEDTIINGNHTVVIDPAVAPTTEKTGLTEGSHCSVCNEVLIKQDVVPALKENGDFSITYNVVGSDTYLATLNINNPNPQSYSSGEVIRLQELEVPGYVFEGWFDGQGKEANRITSLTADEFGNIKLYAHWSLVTYTIDLDNDKSLVYYNPDITSINYTIDKGATLPNLSLNGYYFMGWADENNNLVDSIPKGSFGNKTLYPIWTSCRNSTHPNNYKKEGAVAITEWDDDNGNTNISFVYNIGTIQNVPLYQIGEWMNSNGVKITVQETTTDSFSKEYAENFVKAVSDATTNSASWSLSSEWNKTIEKEETLNQAVSEEQRAAAEAYYEINGAWAISSGIGSGKTTSTSDGFSSKVNVGTKHGDESDSGLDLVILKSTQKKPFEYSNEQEFVGTIESIESKNGYWNTEASFSSSYTAGGSNSFSKAISTSLSKSERYGKIFSSGGASTNTNTTEHYQSSSNSYSNTFVYSTDKVKSTSIEYTNEDAPEGYYRRVLVGTAYVFAVVNYNYATQQFFVNTYSIMDEQSYNPYWDYSASTTNFSDHQNGVLPFEVPFEVNEYVGSLTSITEGLTVDKETGIINGYNGTDTCVIIPKYISYDNKDGTFTSVKVTGIATDVFAGNNEIVDVYLPDSVSEIPAEAFTDCTSLKKVEGKNINSIGTKAFQNCTSLEKVEGKNINSIGTKAFQNCTSLEKYTVNSSVVKLGSKAFENAGTITINAANSDIISIAGDCGATSIILNLKDCTNTLENISMNIPSTAKYFKLEGAGKTLTNFNIVSDAETTEIQNVSLKNTIGRPLVTSSESLIIGSTKITAPALAIVLLSEDTSISAYGQSSIISNGEYAVLSHDESYNGTGETDISKVNITGNIAVCGKVDGEELLNFESGKIVTIDEDEFERLLNNMFTVSFDANGGSVDKKSMQAYSETSLGTLPTPSMSGHVFEGWFTKDGTEVTEKTTFNVAKDITLYAKWTELTLNKSTLTLNTVGASKTYQLTSSYKNGDDVVWKSSDSSIATVSSKGLVTALKDGSVTITATAKGVSVSCKVTVKTAYNETWSAWSDWTTNKLSSSDTVEVKTEERSSQVIASYNMDSYATRKANSTQRQFRNYSVNGQYSKYGLSSDYAEWHHSYTFSVAEVNAAKVIAPGEQQGGSQNGVNMSNVNGYSMFYGGTYYTFFITSENYETVYTTYYSSRNLIKTPVEYKN